MIIALFIIGAIALVVSVVAGFLSGSFLISVGGGISSAIVFFALAVILENQENILNQLKHLEETVKRFQRQEKKVCSKCNHSYEGGYSYCPRCGHKE